MKKTFGVSSVKLWVLSIFVLLLLIVPVQVFAIEEIDWKIRHDVDFYETTLKALAEENSDIMKVFSIGRSWRERDLWTAEITGANEGEKTGLYIVANIHGGENESAESAMYFVWWMMENRETEEVMKILENYIIYVTPVMNPDGYAASWVYNTRQNLRPTDLNGDGKPFSDPYTDTNGDGFISEIYTGAKDSKVEDRVRVGMESPDWDQNGIPGDDPKNSTIDLNRTFDFGWNWLDVDEDPVIGSNSFPRAGPDAASEPEVKAVQNFLISHPVYGLVSLHTGIQCVLYPWCYTPEPTKDYEFFKATAQKMIAAFEEPSGGRTMYEKQSYNDYPTTSEMIDWAYGRLGIHAYTVEVYRGGFPDTESTDPADLHTWGNELPEEKWEYVGDWQGLTDVWFRTTSRAQTVRIAPPDQDLMVDGIKDVLLEFIWSEPYGDGPTVPEYLTW